MAQNKSTEYFKKMLIQFVGEADPLYEMLKWVTEKMMQIESETKVGAEKGKHNTGRNTYFSGHRVRRFDTRLGTVYLMIPKLRNGGYIPFFITEKKRAEQALVNGVNEAYINGVSTRKIERLAKSLGIQDISAGQVSEMNKELNQQVESFRTRPLLKEYPVIWIDALYEKIRDNQSVINMAILIVKGINIEGKREILAIEPMYDESAESWGYLFDKMKNRGLEKVWLVVSDAHKGIQKAVKEHFLKSSWQRCKVHFMRNILAHIPNKAKESFGAQIKHIWLQPSIEDARLMARKICDKNAAKYPEAICCLEEGLEDSLQFFNFETIDRRKISSTNTLERLNEEIRRRSRVVGIFPSKDAYVRLVCCYLLEYSEDWIVERSYINKEILLELKSTRDVA